MFAQHTFARRSSNLNYLIVELDLSLMWEQKTFSSTNAPNHPLPMIPGTVLTGFERKPKTELRLKWVPSLPTAVLSLCYLNLYTSSKESEDGLSSTSRICGDTATTRGTAKSSCLFAVSLRRSRPGLSSRSSCKTLSSRRDSIKQPSFITCQRQGTRLLLFHKRQTCVSLKVNATRGKTNTHSFRLRFLKDPSFKLFQQCLKIQQKLAIRPPPNFTKTLLYHHLGFRWNSCCLSNFSGQQGQPLKSWTHTAETQAWSWLYDRGYRENKHSWNQKHATWANCAHAWNANFPVQGTDKSFRCVLGCRGGVLPCCASVPRGREAWIGRFWRNNWCASASGIRRGCRPVQCWRRSCSKTGIFLRWGRTWASSANAATVNLLH